MSPRNLFVTIACCVAVAVASALIVTMSGRSDPTRQPAGAPDITATQDPDLAGLMPPGGHLPSGAQCAGWVQRDPWEPRPENTQANQTTPPVPYPGKTGTWSTEAADELKSRVDGQFTGTTDEIIQWAACKWGYPTELARAQAVEESNWDQSTTGDHGQSFGLLQVKQTAWPGTLPWSRDSTAYNADWTLGVWRACYEGLMYYGPQSRGDAWGCVGAWYSGDWHDSAAESYIRRVRNSLHRKPYLRWDSEAGGHPPTSARLAIPPAPR